MQNECELCGVCTFTKSTQTTKSTQSTFLCHKDIQDFWMMKVDESEKQDRVDGQVNRNDKTQTISSLEYDSLEPRKDIDDNWPIPTTKSEFVEK